jgi:hypothetical protein
LEFVLRVSLIGIGATLILDLWSFFLRTVFGVPFPNYTLVGRWIGHFPHGRFVQVSVAEAPSVPGEHLIGWIAHYGIGILYAVLLVVFAGLDWLSAPTVIPALIVGVVTVAAPFFVMQPAMGSGIAASKEPKPNVARLRSIAAHTVFGLGLYLSALVVALLWWRQAEGDLGFAGPILSLCLAQEGLGDIGAFAANLHAPGAGPQ